MGDGDTSGRGQPRARRSPDELFAGGERQAAYIALVHAEGRRVLGVCLRVLGNRADAEEVRQQVFLEALRDLAAFQGRSSMRTWLYRIVGHRCQDRMRSTGRRRAHVQEDDDDAALLVPCPDGGPAIELAAGELRSTIEACLRELSPPARLAVLLRFYADLSYEDMELELGTKADTLQRRVARALPALGACLEQRGVARA